ncbi:MAG: hypothetical protein NTZ54_15885, partial [Alphaproteobacteria bacterium]|nr:hypothetical protein [Alphaproteobacteria bacterium]
MEQIKAFLTARGDLLLLAMVFLAVAILTFAFGSITRSWSGVRRRVSVPGGPSITAADPMASVQRSKFLNSSGYYGNRALVWFQASRIAMALACGILTAVMFGRLYPNRPIAFTILACVVLTFIGYMLPRAIVSVRRDKLFEEHRQGFPDFLDLLVICVEAGISVDASMDRIARDLARDYPSLAR